MRNEHAVHVDSCRSELKMALSDGEKLLVGSIPSRKDAVLHVLRTAIIEGRFGPGERLEPDRIAADLGCSRMPIREALKILENEGFVTCYPFRGTEVSRLRAEEVEELFAMRIALECLALARAVPNLTTDELAQMRGILTTSYYRNGGSYLGRASRSDSRPAAHRITLSRPYSSSMITMMTP
jgi:DNA-binding transcriptional regulator YhcF (GntR family)